MAKKRNLIWLWMTIAVIVSLIVGGLIGANLLSKKSNSQCFIEFNRDRYVRDTASFDNVNGFSVNLQNQCDYFCGQNKGVPIDAKVISVSNNQLQLALNCGCLRGADNYF